MTALPSVQPTFSLAQIVAARGFRVTILGKRIFSAEKHIGPGRIRMMTVRWNRAQDAWTGKLQTQSKLA